MTAQQLRWTLLAMAGALVAFVGYKRRQQLSAALPQPLLQGAERFVIPWPGSDRGPSAIDEAQVAEDEEPEGESLRRKVSTGSRISFLGKRYGPLPESLVGQYVEAETRDDQLYILHDGTPIATFKLQS